jgi:hypothetical protein
MGWWVIMKFLTAVVADIAIAFIIWVISGKLTSGWLVFIVVLGLLAIASLTTSAVTVTAMDVEDNKVKATVDDIRK